MNTWGTSRRDFIRGALASLGFCALGDGLLFAAPPGWKPSGQPNLVFGVVSDTHLKTGHSGKSPGRSWPTKYLESAFKYFRDANVDAVVHCGDMAHRGQVREIEFHAEVWNKVFPKNRAPDGHVVEKLFVTGNHDIEGSGYGDFVAGIYPDPDVRAKRVFATDIAGNWQRIWGVKYEPVWHKVVKGYHFVGRHWNVHEKHEVKFLKENAKLFGDGGSNHPLFLLSHVRPHAALSKTMKQFDNAVAFHGHWHVSATNWNVLRSWNGKTPVFNCPSCEPRGTDGLVDDDYISKAKIIGRSATGKGRQGYIVRVYDDMLTIERREFGEGGSLGADWVLPFSMLPSGIGNIRADRKRRIGSPQFGKSAKLKVESVKFAKGEDGVRVTIPRADGNPNSCIYAYEVAVTGETLQAPSSKLQALSSKLLKAVYASGVNMGIGHEPNNGITTIDIPKKELPKGDVVTFSVCPLSSLGTRGNPITLKYQKEPHEKG